MPEATDGVENTCSVPLEETWVNEEKQTLSGRSSSSSVIPEMNIIPERDQMKIGQTNGVCNFGFIEVR